MTSLNENVLLYQALKQFDIYGSNEHLHDFNFISATIGNLMPDLAFEEHEAIAKESAFCQILSVRDEKDYALIKQVTKPDIDFSKRIIVTFHYSSYRLFSALLIAWSVPFKLVADNNYIQNQGEASVAAYHSIARELNAQSHDFEIINAEDRTVILKCMEAIKQGYSLVFYADGNSGVGGMTKEKNNMLKIPFLQSSIYVRKGIPTLASLLQIPITTVTIQRDILSDTVTFNIREHIDFPKDRKNEQEVTECATAIFQNLEEQIRAHPGRWEGWFYYHNFIDFEQDAPAITDNILKASKTIFNHRYYGIGLLADAMYYILHKRTLRLVPISEDVFNELLYIARTNSTRAEFPVFKSLVTEGILVPRTLA